MISFPNLVYRCRGSEQFSTIRIYQVDADWENTKSKEIRVEENSYSFLYNEIKIAKQQKTISSHSFSYGIMVITKSGKPQISTELYTMH